MSIFDFFRERNLNSTSNNQHEIEGLEITGSELEIIENLIVTTSQNEIFNIKPKTTLEEKIILSDADHLIRLRRDSIKGDSSKKEDLDHIREFEFKYVKNIAEAINIIIRLKINAYNRSAYVSGNVDKNPFQSEDFKTIFMLKKIQQLFGKYLLRNNHTQTVKPTD